MSNLSKKEGMQIIASRLPVHGPGKYQARVTNDVQKLAESGLVHRDYGTTMQISIANFAAYTQYHLDRAKEFFAVDAIQQGVNQQLTSSVRSTDYIPKKGETVEIIVDFVKLKSGEQALLVTSYHPLPLQTPTKKSVSDIESFFNSDRVEMTTKTVVTAEAVLEGTEQKF